MIVAPFRVNRLDEQTRYLATAFSLSAPISRGSQTRP
jgi:hypothetical protein